MSSLRVDTLRLCWLEAFIEVAQEANISEAANVLGINQSMVTRYIQSLEKWLGRKLIEPGKISEPDEPRVSVGLTDDGDQVYRAIYEIVPKLCELRHENARKAEIIETISYCVSKMEADLTSAPKIKTAHEVSDQIQNFRTLLDALNMDIDTEHLSGIERAMKRFFMQYEAARNREMLMRGRRSARSKLDDRFDQRPDAGPPKISPRDIVL